MMRTRPGWTGAVVILWALGCHGGDGADVSALQASGRVELVVPSLSREFDRHFEWVESRFEETHSGTDLIVRIQGADSPAEYAVDLGMRAVLDSLPDVWFVDRRRVAALAALDRIDAAPEDFSEWWAEEVTHPVAFDGGRIDGVLYGPTVAADWPALIYRQDHLRRSGFDRPPADLQELLVASRSLVRRDTNDRVSRAGIALKRGGTARRLAEGWLALVGACGGPKAVSAEVEELVGMPAALCAFDVYGTLLADGMLPDAPRGTAVEMANGRCSMIFGRAWTLAWLRTTEVAGRIAVAPMPQGPGGGGAPAEAYVYVVRRGAPPVAWELVRWLVSGESYARFVSRTGAVPLTRAVSADTLDEALATYLAQGGIVFPEVDLDGGWEIIGEALRDYIGRAGDFEEFVDPAPSPS